MKQERQPLESSSLTIRFHHLGLFYDITSSFGHKFDDVKPWTLSKDKKMEINQFVDNFVERDFDGWEAATNYLENLSIADGDFNTAKKLKYIYDLNGSTKSDRFFASHARKQMFKLFFEISSSDKQTLIPLTLDKDTYCHTCVVGKHCNRNLLQKIAKNDRDYVFEKALKSLSKVDEWGWGIKIDSKGFMFITPEVLFDTDFYSTLWEEIKRGGDGDWI